MPWKLIGTLILFTVFVFFMGFNWEHSSVISFGFAQIENVPIILSLSISFLTGAFFAIPFVLSSNRRRKQLEAAQDLEGKAPVKAGRKSRKKTAETALAPLTEETPGNEEIQN